jgi:hypothetical protein
MVITVVVNLGLKNVIAINNGQWAWGRQCVAEVSSVVAPAVMGHGKNRIRMASLTAASLIPNAHCPMPYRRIRFSKDNLSL